MLENNPTKYDSFFDIKDQISCLDMHHCYNAKLNCQKSHNSGKNCQTKLTVLHGQEDMTKHNSSKY